DHAQHRGLPRSGGAQYRHRFPRLHPQADAADHRGAVITAGDGVEFQYPAGAGIPGHGSLRSVSFAGPGATVAAPGVRPPPAPQPNDRLSTNAGMTATTTNMAAYGAACE